MNYPHKLNKDLSNLLEGEEEKIDITTKPSVYTAEVTPKQARYILNHCQGKVKNRKPSPHMIKKYAYDMQNNQWRFTGDGLGFAKDKGLIQGQHRLFAAIKSNKTIKFNITTGLDYDSFKYMDQGKSRTFTNILESSDFDQSMDLKILAPMSRLVWLYLNDKLEKRGGSAERFFTRIEGLELIKERPEICDYIERYKNCRIVSPTIAAFVYWLLSQYDEGSAEVYLDKVFKGVNLTHDSVEYKIHQRLVKNATNPHKKMERTSVISWIIMGWRIFIGLSKTKNPVLNTNTSKKIPNPFPEDFEI